MKWHDWIAIIVHQFVLMWCGYRIGNLIVEGNINEANKAIIIIYCIFLIMLFAMYIRLIKAMDEIIKSYTENNKKDAQK